MSINIQEVGAGVQLRQLSHLCFFKYLIMFRKMEMFSRT